MTRCRHRAAVTLRVPLYGHRVYDVTARQVRCEDVALEVSPPRDVEARCGVCGYTVTKYDPAALPAWARRAWERARLVWGVEP
jgi:hypothetical protein